MSAPLIFILPKPHALVKLILTSGIGVRSPFSIFGIRRENLVETIILDYSSVRSNNGKWRLDPICRPHLYKVIFS